MKENDKRETKMNNIPPFENTNSLNNTNSLISNSLKRKGEEAKDDNIKIQKTAFSLLNNSNNNNSVSFKNLNAGKLIDYARENENKQETEKNEIVKILSENTQKKTLCSYLLNKVLKERKPTSEEFKAILEVCNKGKLLQAAFFWGKYYLCLCIKQGLPDLFTEIYLFLNENKLVSSDTLKILQTSFDKTQCNEIQCYTHQLYFDKDHPEKSLKICLLLLKSFPGFLQIITKQGLTPQGNPKQVKIPANPFNEQIIKCCYYFFDQISSLEEFIENTHQYSPDKKIIWDLCCDKLPFIYQDGKYQIEKPLLFNQFISSIETCLENEFDNAFGILVDFYLSFLKKYIPKLNNEDIIRILLEKIKCDYYQVFLNKIYNISAFKTHEIIVKDFEGKEKTIQVNKFILEKRFSYFSKFPSTGKINYSKYGSIIIPIIRSCYSFPPPKECFEQYIEEAIKLGFNINLSFQLDNSLSELHPDQDFFQIIFRETLSEELEEKNFLENFRKRMQFCRDKKYIKAENFLAEAYLLYARAAEEIGSELFSEIFSYIYLNNLLSPQCEKIINSTLGHNFYETHLIKFDKDKEIGVNLYFLANVSQYFKSHQEFSGKNKNEIVFRIYDATIMDNLIDYCYFCEKEKFQSKITKENLEKYLDYANLLNCAHVILAIVEKICILYDQNEVENYNLLNYMMNSFKLLLFSPLNINTKFIHLLAKTSLSCLIEQQRFNANPLFFSPSPHLKDLEQFVQEYGREIKSFSAQNYEKNLINDEFLHFLFTYCPNLEKLELPCCEKITFHSLQEIKNLPYLTYLDMHSCPTIGLEIMGSLLQLKKLEEIILTNTHWISLNIFKEFATKLHNLKRIDFSMTYFPVGVEKTKKNQITTMNADPLYRLKDLTFSQEITFNAYGKLNQQVRIKLPLLYENKGKKIFFPDEKE